ncbi:bifunctional glutamate N-acetyltransferase/amino-acid acetyltransferase ArgJ [Bacillus thermotolerans]|uniref:Arginine biosynthesis bifunctional protein ArgJ n=1 Tax=Bacillus thermotolerans TaxID=1221996 RepID=A0A0F5I3D1_BACTR|nr:bifunctional glutamate N-acetyltransferase/amino-acid acetyltransferase ArgJ [Bacillus thermotolerans]KKB36978.1 Glutamate N-acetyltransferase [Bacillus thermotolerans]KKB40021.1 Glutamate N-acetyltransferase [Bacillus thermotolerans]
MQTLEKSKPIKVLLDGSIVSPKGFAAAGIHAGLRYSKNDLGVIFSEVPAESAAVYTTSHFQAAPIKVTQDSLAVENKLQAILVNSACANACTGKRGLADAYQTREWLAEHLNIPEHYVAVSSTGVIGEYLNMEKMEQGIKNLHPKAEAADAEQFESAILTTDLATKRWAVEATIEGKTVTMGGAAKGSGMIHPNMATMLAYVTTDACISSEHLHTALKEVTDQTFNQITVDGDTSTNDTVVVMANGLAGHSPLSPQHPEWATFVSMLKEVSEQLAKKIARDGEGATKLIEVKVNGAVSDEEAQRAAKEVVGSSLVKTAVFGADANWGRIIGAIGYSPIEVNPETIDIAVGNHLILSQSEVADYSEEELTAYLKDEEEIKITVHLNIGEGSGTAWGCDLSYDYVKINASYRT